MGELTDGQRETLRHALGLTKHRRWSYRNHYVTDPDDADIAPLVAAGLMRSTSALRPGGMVVYGVTCAGIKAAGVSHKVRREDRIG